MVYIGCIIPLGGMWRFGPGQHTPANLDHYILPCIWDFFSTGYLKYGVFEMGPVHSDDNFVHTFYFLFQNKKGNVNEPGTIRHVFSIDLYIRLMGV